MLEQQAEVAVKTPVKVNQAVGIGIVLAAAAIGTALFLASSAQLTKEAADVGKLVLQIPK